MFPLQRLRRKSLAFRVFLAILVGLTFTFLFWSTPTTQLPLSTTDPPSIKDLPSASLVATRIFNYFFLNEADRLSTHVSQKQSKKGKKGVLNLHFWDEICGENLQSLRNFPLFPNMPTTRTTATLSISRYGANYGLRMFGFLVPPETRAYDFVIISSGSAELWLSESSDPRGCKLVCRAKETGKTHLFSYGLTHSNVETVSLERNKEYYIEILHKQALHVLQSDYFAVKWKPSSKDKNSDFSDIPSMYLRSFQDDGHLLDYDVDFDSFPGASLPMHRKDKLPSREDMVQSYRLPFFKDAAYDLFPSCPYSPSYLIGPEKNLRRYGSVWETHYTSVFPATNSDITSHTGFISFGNDALEEASAKRVVSMVAKQLNEKHKGQYIVQDILNVEENHDAKKGDRYLVELIVQDTTSKKKLRFSEYLYQPKEIGQLFYPENISWNKSAVINIIVTCGRNQLRWLYHFIDNMAHIYNVTKDSHFNVIIVDFHDSVTELKAALERSTIPNYMLLHNKGKFHKTLGIENAANMVKDPNSIIFVVDLHLEIPSNIFDEIRKHCIQGHVTYAPLLARLECGATALAPTGFWEYDGYGLIGMYKSDWDRFGGMNIKEFMHSWGGEDWEMADRILMAGLEIERLKVPFLYHYHHSKKGMWTDSHK